MSNTGSSMHTGCNSVMAGGTTYTVSGAYPVTYTNAAGCDSVHTFNVTVNMSSSSNTAITATGSYTWPISGATYTTSGTYTNAGLTAAGCPKNDTLVLTIIPLGVVVAPKAMLSGPYSVTELMMKDDLRSKGLIPTTEPYSAAPFTTAFTHVGGGGETVSAAVLAVTGTDAIVDWVFVSLRDASNPATVIATQSALIQRDGDIVSATDGTSPLTFNVSTGNYYVAVDHRNHLGIMTASAQALSTTVTALNLTNGSTPLYLKPTGNNPAPLTGATKNQGGVRTMYSGNCNVATLIEAKRINYGPAPTTDRAVMLSTLGATATVNGYTIFDVDMNGFARYNGLNPDRLVISATVLNNNAIVVNEQQP